MKISATSALVLHWTAPEVWQSAEALKYSQSLDRGEATDLLKIFSAEENHMHLQAVSNRKFFVRKYAVRFIEQCNARGGTPQVIILAAGIAPLSIELSALFPHAKIFDVDQYLMPEKETFLKSAFPAIRFISCDITLLAELERALYQNGWDREQPTLIILEGIIYYLSKSELEALLTFFADAQAALAADFALEPTLVAEHNRFFGVEVFRKIKEAVGLGHIQYYEPGYFLDLLQSTGFHDAERTLMAEIQQEFRGTLVPFEEVESGWISMVAVPSRHPLLAAGTDSKSVSNNTEMLAE